MKFELKVKFYFGLKFFLIKYLLLKRKMKNKKIIKFWGLTRPLGWLHGQVGFDNDITEKKTLALDGGYRFYNQPISRLNNISSVINKI